MLKRVIITGILVLACCLVAVAVSAEGLDAACRQAQLAVQSQVGDVTSYANHGQLMKAVAAAANVFLESGEIDAECHSCIVSQYARRIPVADMEACGPDSPNPECQGSECGNLLPCNEPNSCPTPLCFTTAEGGGLCAEGSTACAGLLPCQGTGDCPPGSICVVRSCCGDPVCVPPEAFCLPGGPLRTTAVPAGTRTLGDPGN